MLTHHLNVNLVLGVEGLLKIQKLILTAYQEVFKMKPEIHPEYKEVTVSCSCGAEYKTKSTRFEDFTVEVCSNCHPFYTGKERAAEAKGRVERFRKKYSKN